MQVKVFESDDMASGLKKIKETLGPDALILSTRTMRRKGLGVLGKPYLEITAAKESPELKHSGGLRKAVAIEEAPLPEERVSLSSHEKRKGEDRLLPLEQEILGLKKRLEGHNFQELKEEIGQLKELFREFSGRALRAAAASEPPAHRGGQGPERVAERLQSCGVEWEVAHTLVSSALRHHSPVQLEDPDFFETLLREAVAELIPVSGPLAPAAGKPLKVALIGPTGVGKTTTVAKLAAEYLFRTRGKVALVTIDTYRIAAAEQLRIYGEIMRVPVEVVLHPDQLAQAFAKHADKDLILIDTAGRSPRDEAKIDELAAFLGPESGVDNHLVLAAHTRHQELEDTIRCFDRLPLQNFIFTKLDECDSCGALINIPVRHALPVSFLTNGQRVPEDLLIADPAIINDFLLKKVRK
ncbi:MAG: flagellar biosynthesis protein FlhF [Deltaproteobacteria bacterium]|nr:flagellar biosynthesis protein FlhF [Deltaproteobacteria bacterium]